MHGIETEASTSIFKRGCMQRIEKVTIPKTLIKIAIIIWNCLCWCVTHIVHM